LQFHFLVDCVDSRHSSLQAGISV